MASCFALAACGAAAPQPLVTADVSPSATATAPPPITSASPDAHSSALPPPYSPVAGLEIQDLVIGTGREAHDGDRIQVLYEGTLEDGTVFDGTSIHNNEPIRFRLGQGQLIKGWELGIPGMKVGGKRRLVIAPNLAYGSRRMGAIPPGSTLTFVVELVDVL
jgi:FKBP-type peptidyl-prolyl cis-trans isomerase